MRYEVQLELEDHHRMLSRVLQALEHAQAIVEHLTLDRRAGRLHCCLIAQVDSQRRARMESLLWKIHSVVRLSVYASPSPSTGCGRIP
ncbi:hypothetical protein FTW19_05590 [Terriglobus albidus]|uniref:Uncharacterized protein n=1 Tax=Terriglobus albidus TaxID=1592106 RepID=A0A5B9EB77_9BACT|nr:hypothetical protein [Terriglobus albidus]QEE27527.1 hypothetical protein FTW19_05590 [Terriglobus albidus]